MKTTLRVAWATLALIAGLALAGAAAFAATVPEQAAAGRLDDLRMVMHYGAFTAKPLDKGTEVTITSGDPLVAKAIRAEFGGGQHPVRTAIPDTTLTAKLLDNGAVLTFRSADASRAEALKAAGVYAAYDTLRGEIRNLAWQTGVPGAGFHRGPGGMGRGWGDGPGRGPGYGPGTGPGIGYGPRGR